MIEARRVGVDETRSSTRARGGAALRRGVGVVVSYAVLVAWLTWPLARFATTHFPATLITASSDVPLVAWALAHETRALASDPSSLPDGGIFHPTPRSLFYGEAGFGALPLFAPVFLATGNPTLAIDLVFLAGVVLSAAAVHCVTYQWTRSHLGGVVAGATFLTTPWVLWSWIPTAPNYAVLFYLPFVMWLAAPVTTTWRRAAALAVLVALQGLTSAYVAFATCAPLGLLAAVRCLRRTTRRSGIRLLASLGLASALLVAPYLGHYLVHEENPSIEGQSLYALMTVRPAHVPDDVFRATWPTALPGPAWVLMLLGLLCRRFAPARTTGDGLRDGWRHAGLWTIAGLYFSLTPVIDAGGTRLPLPHVVLAPVYSALRASSRFGVATLVGGSVLTGVAFGELQAHARGRMAALARLGGAGLVLASLAFAYFRPFVALSRPLAPSEPYPLATAPVPAGRVYATIARSEGPLLELPVGPDASGHARAMYLSIFHRRPLLNGYSGYWPAAFPERMALACKLPDPAALAALERATGVRLILVHSRVIGVARRVRGAPPYQCPPDGFAPGAEMKAWLDIATEGTRTDLRLIDRDPNGDLLFRVSRPTG